MDSAIQKKILSALAGIPHERCILFGSRARGDFTPDSDYDLLIIVRDPLSGNRRIELATQIRKVLADSWINADVIIKSHGETDYYRNKVGSIVQNALEEGIAV
jgi:predicted nucleotidyltransferase